MWDQRVATGYGQKKGRQYFRGARIGGRHFRYWFSAVILFL